MTRRVLVITMFRANFGDGTHSQPYTDIRDARCEKWGRAAIVQYRTSIERLEGNTWIVVEPSRASLTGPPIVEKRS